MLEQGTIPLNDKEQAAIDEIRSEIPDVQFSLSRRDPGETGPVIVHIPGSDPFELKAG